MIQSGKKITGADLVDQREELGMSVTDHFWLFGVLTRTFRTTKEGGQKPIESVPTTILARYLDKFPEENPVPQMPEWDETFDAVKEVDASMSPRKFGIHFGTTGWTGNRWYHGGKPSPPVQRLFYILLNGLAHEGAEALYKFVSVLEEEAYARGFQKGFEEVLKNGSWKRESSGDNKDSSEDEETGAQTSDK